MATAVALGGLLGDLPILYKQSDTPCDPGLVAFIATFSSFQIKSFLQTQY